MSEPRGRRPDDAGVYTRKKKRGGRAMSLVVLLLALVVLLGVAYVLYRLLAGPGDEAPVSSSVPAVSAVSAASAPPQSAAPQSAAPVVPAATGELDVAGLPPLYNWENPIPKEKHGDNITLGETVNGYQMEPQAAMAFTAMVKAAQADGVTLTPVSGYRSNQRQTDNYNAALQRNLETYGSQAEAERQTALYYAKPGTSEHEAGLAMDIGSVDDSFANTPAYTWLRAHCAEYGFIYRYPDGTRSDGADYTETLTHIAWEPWHYRFVGANHAAEIERLSALLPGEDDVLTLEEYVAYLNGERVAVLDGVTSDKGGASASQVEMG